MYSLLVAVVLVLYHEAVGRVGQGNHQCHTDLAYHAAAVQDQHHGTGGCSYYTSLNDYVKDEDLHDEDQV